MNNKLSDKWNTILRQDGLIPAPRCDRRPFTCNFNGFPDECNVVFIGKNPKNELGVNWWCLWDDNTGFNYDYFMSVYPTDEASKTRLFYQEVAALGCKSIETNVYSHSHSQSLTSNQQVLCTILDNLPRGRRVGLIPYGTQAKNFISTYSVPDKWCVLMLESHIGYASDAEKERTKRFCQSMI